MNNEFDIEVTDTFCGESNYSWVRRTTITAPPALSRLCLVRRVKAAIGWTGMPCQVSPIGNALEIRPKGRALVAFVYPA